MGKKIPLTLPSDVLFHVSAAELTVDEMIKLPIRLNTNVDWCKVIGQTLDCQAALEVAAVAERADTGEYFRPIILFQAQAKSKTGPDRLTPEKIEQFPTDDKRIPRIRLPFTPSAMPSWTPFLTSRRQNTRRASSSTCRSCARAGIALSPIACVRWRS